MMRSVAFTNTKNYSNQITNLFNSASRSYFELFNEEDSRIVEVSSKHINDGKSGLERNRLMSWLKDGDKTILTNL
jgi:predicted helicase